MTFEITRQERYSRGELLLRSVFGFLYIGIPHGLVLFFLGLWGGILGFVSFWAILFTGRYPQSFFEFQIGLHRWQTRVNATLWNLRDGYPAFGMRHEDADVTYDLAYPDSLGRGKLLLKVLLGWLYCALPHVFCLYFRILASAFLGFLAWWALLFTASYPAGMFAFNVGTLRWQARLGLYLGLMTDDYPPFSGKP